MIDGFHRDKRANNLIISGILYHDREVLMDKIALILDKMGIKNTNKIAAVYRLGKKNPKMRTLTIIDRLCLRLRHQKQNLIFCVKLNATRNDKRIKMTFYLEKGTSLSMSVKVHSPDMRITGLGKKETKGNRRK